MIIISNMDSPRTGNAVANQFDITTDKGNYFQSYRAVIAHKCSRGVTLSSQWEYSVTTLKYLREFLGVFSVKEIRESIKNGEYKVVDEIEII